MLDVATFFCFILGKKFFGGNYEKQSVPCFIFIGFGVLAITILISIYYISSRFGWFFILILGILSVFWFSSAFYKVDYRINLPTSEMLAAYVVPESKLKRTYDNHYQLAVPKSEFVNKKVIRSDSGYTQIDGKTFKINGHKIVVEDPNNIVRHHVFGRRSAFEPWAICNIVYGNRFHLNGDDFNDQDSLLSDQHFFETKLPNLTENDRSRMKMYSKHFSDDVFGLIANWVGVLFFIIAILLVIQI